MSKNKMTKQTFEKLVWELVKEERNQTLIIDNFHSYAMIKDRVDSLWECIRMLQPEDDQEMILGALVALSSYCQLSAENLGLTPEQIGRDESIDILEEEAEQGRAMARRFVDILDRDKRVTKSLQKGRVRYSFEFDAAVLESWKEQVEK